MSGNSVYKVGIVISADASGVKPGATSAKSEIASIGTTAEATQTKMQSLIATATGLHAGAANGNSRAWVGALAAEGLALDNLRAKYNPLFAVIRQYKAALTEIRTANAMGALSADEMTAAISRQRQATLASIDAIKGRNQAITAGATVARQANGHGQANFAATNAMFQLQDVAMTAAMGMNPAMIALQQGSQLAGNFAGMGLKQVGTTMLGAFTALLSPVSLATVAVTGLTAAAIQYFSKMGDETDGVSDSLREQADLIAKVATAWGDATPKIKAYADELEKAAKAKDRLKAGEAIATEQYKPIEDTLGGLTRPFGAAQRELQGFGADAAPALKMMTESVITLQDKIKAGTATTSDLSKTQQALAETLNLAGTPAVKRFVSEFEKVAPQIKMAVAAAQQFRQEGAGSILPQLGQLAPLFSTDGKIRSPEDFIPKGNIPIPLPRPLIELEGLPGQVEKEKALADAKRDRARSLNETVEKQQLELTLIGKTAAEQAALRMEYEQTAALRAEAARTGVAVDEREIALIREKSRAYGALQEELAAINILRDQQTNLQTLSAEISLVGQSEEVRRRSLALLEAEQKIAAQGIAANSGRADQIRKASVAIADQTAKLERLRDAWGAVQSSAEGAIDGAVNKLLDGDFSGALESISGDVTKLLTDMPITNSIRYKLCEAL